MVAQLLRLKLRLLGNSFQRSAWQIVGVCIALIYGLGAGVVAMSALIGLRLAPVALASSVVTVFGSAVILGFIVFPLLFGVDDVMDPRRFGLFGIPTSRLASGLALAALISVPSLVILLVSLAQVMTWSRGGLPVLLALLAVPLIVATSVLCARVATAVAGFLLSTRRARDAMGLAGILLLVVIVPVFILLLGVDWQSDGLRVLHRIATVAGWTPLGAAWSAPADAAAGHAGSAWLKVLEAVATVVALWFAWRTLVAAMLVTMQRTAQAKEYHGIGWFRVFRSSPAGAIAARSVTYWIRDSRYHVSLVILPLVPVVMIVPLMVAGVPTHLLALLPVPVIALFLGWSVHNDVSYDNTAIWLHVASDAPGRADRFGRVVPPLLLGIPVVIAASFLCAALFGSDRALPALVAVGVCILLSGLGLSSIMSARFPYPSVRPGDSPFAQPQSGGTAASLIQFLSFITTFILSAPTVWFAYLALIRGGVCGWAVLVLGVGSGLFFLGVGVLWGGRIFRRRAPELLAFSVRN